MNSLSIDLHSKKLKFNEEMLKSLHVELSFNCGLKEYFTVAGSLQRLQHTLFFYIVLEFYLRDVLEQYELSPSQLTCYPPHMMVYNEEVYYQYTEFILKNNKYKIKDTNISNK